MAEQGTAADLRSALVRDKLDWLELRLDRLEHPKDEPKPRASPLTFLVAGIDKIAAWLPAVTPIVLFVLGTWFVNAAGDVVENQRVALENQRLALQERQVELGGIAEMREIVAELYEDGITSTEAEATALSLAAFGALAAPPLIHAIETGDAVRMTGAETGLAAAALADPRGVCRILAGVIANRTALYSWQTQQSAVKLLGRLGCRDQRLSVEAFGRLLAEGSAAYQATVRQETAIHEVNDAKLLRLQEQQQLALARLDMAEKRATPAVVGPASPGPAPADRGSAASRDRSGGAD
jgi:hypothetical protein